MVPSSSVSTCPEANIPTAIENSVVPPNLSECNAPTLQENETSYLSLVRKRLIGENIAPNVIEIILSSWRSGTQNQYSSSIRKWFEFCTERSINIVAPTIPQVLSFLTMIHEDGLSYSSVNTAKSALSSVLDLGTETPLGQLPIIKRFMKGVFERRPSFPKHKNIWDVKTVLDFFRKQGLPSELSLKDLSAKVAFLLCLLSGQRCQTIKLLNIESMQVLEHEYVFFVDQKVKQTRVGFHIEPIRFLEYPSDKRLCVFTHLNEYIQRTKPIRKSDQLLISYLKPHASISTDTLARWVKNMLSSAGVDTSKFKAHSTRSAATSFAAKQNVNVTDILSAVGWSSEQTFQRFYNRPDQTDFNFGTVILNSSDL